MSRLKKPLKKPISISQPTVVVFDCEYIKPMPIFGLSTYLIRGNEFKKNIKKAVESGCRNFECNFDLKELTDLVEALNEQIFEGVVAKNDIFLTVKCTLAADETGQSSLMYNLFYDSKKRNGLEYIDLLLLHNEVPTKKKVKKKLGTETESKYVPYSRNRVYNAWVGFREYWRCGLTNLIGLSNFSAEQVKDVLSFGSCLINTIDSSHYLISNELIEICRANNIILSSFNSLGKHQEHKKFKSLPVVTDPRIFDIAKRYKKSTPEIIARYLAESGTISKDYLQQNTDIFNFKLKPNEMKTLEDSAYCFSKFFAHDVIYYKDRNVENQT